MNKYVVTATSSKVFDFSYPEKEFDSHLDAMTYAKEVARRVAIKAAGTGGALFPRIIEFRNEVHIIDYEIEVPR